MSRNGSGVYSLPAPPSPFVNGQTASATDMMTVLNDIASALTDSVSADGQTPLTGTLNANGNSITAVNAIGAASLVTTAGILVGNGLTITKGGATVTAGGLTVTAGGATITGNSTITGTLGGLTGFTVASGGAAVTGNSTVTGTLTVSSTLTAANGTTGTQVVNYSQFPATLTTTGTETMPSGRIMKWGTGTYTAGTGSITFSSAFPTGMLHATVSLATSGAAHGSRPPGPDPSTYSKTGFTVYGGIAESGSFTWMAIGY